MFPAFPLCIRKFLWSFDASFLFFFPKIFLNLTVFLMPGTCCRNVELADLVSIVISVEVRLCLRETLWRNQFSSRVTSELLLGLAFGCESNCLTTNEFRQTTIISVDFSWFFFCKSSSKFAGNLSRFSQHDWPLDQQLIWWFGYMLCDHQRWFFTGPNIRSEFSSSSTSATDNRMKSSAKIVVTSHSGRTNEFRPITILFLVFDTLKRFFSLVFPQVFLGFANWQI